jgi:hypothetical protein
MTSLIKLLRFKTMWGAAGVDAPHATVASAIAAAADEGWQGIGYSPLARSPHTGRPVADLWHVVHRERENLKRVLA